ncbi:SRPBCC domain-containing protein [Paenibacillus sp. GCM10023252]
MIRGLTDPELTEQYYFGSRIRSDWQVGDTYSYRNPDDSILLDGSIVALEPGTRIVMTFRPVWAYGDQPPVSEVVYELEAASPSVTQLTLTHRGLPAEDPVSDGIRAGWVQILTGLKTVVEK